MEFITSLLGRKKAVGPDRRSVLLASGRITDGVIIDTKIDADGRELVVFVYTLNGVDFESADELTPAQKQDGGSYVPGAKVGYPLRPKEPVRFSC